MNKGILFGVIAGGLVLIGGGAYLVSTKDSNDSTNDNNTSEQQSVSDNGSPVFKPLATKNLPFEATFTSTDADGTISSGLIQTDGLGNSKFSGESEGVPYAIYTVDGVYYSCTNDKCMKMPKTQDAGNTISAEDYEISDEDFDAYKNNAVYKGKSDCPAGKCDTWEVTEEDGLKATLYISGDNRVSKIKGDDNGGNYEMSFDYKDVKIVAPENATEMPSFN